MIQSRLKPRRPVEVINAGVPAYTIENNLYRLPDQMLPLKPDMIICYHGINGFHLLDEALPQMSDDNPPLFFKRPLNLLANSEYRLRIIRFNRARGQKLALHTPDFANLMDTKYARAYRQLIQISQTNQIRLVLGNFSMAVNRRSDPDLIAFYRETFPEVHWQIKANAALSQLVSQIAHDCPEVCLVNTNPSLDGEHTKFTDLVHLTQEGRQQLAETFFAGIKPLLERDLGRGDSTPETGTASNTSSKNTAGNSDTSNRSPE